MFDMFYNDQSLLKLNLKNFNSETTKEFGQFLVGCKNLTLYLGKNNDRCRNLEEVVPGYVNIEYLE
jgi:hypothetical protein